jgi:hypothetical protein
MGVVEGKKEGIYAPNDDVSRAELIKIAVNAFGYEVSDAVEEDVLSDVKQGDWYAPFVKSAFSNGVIFGFESGLQPNTPTSRGMAVTILAKAARFDDVESNFDENYNKPGWTYAHFPDVLLDAYFAPFIAYFYDNGIIDGYEDGSFGPGNPITRAEIAKIVVNLLDLIKARQTE